MSSGWNDHLADPDAWEDYAEALRDRADDDRKHAKEDGDDRPAPQDDDGLVAA